MEGVMNQMVELKQNADQIETKVYEYLQQILGQVKNAYQAKSE
jgi:hypothetical protein